MTPSPYFKNKKAFTTLHSTKNSERKLMMAKMFDVNTMNGPSVSANIAGTE